MLDDADFSRLEPGTYRIEMIVWVDGISKYTYVKLRLLGRSIWSKGGSRITTAMAFLGGALLQNCAMCSTPVRDFGAFLHAAPTWKMFPFAGENELRKHLGPLLAELERVLNPNAVFATKRADVFITLRFRFLCGDHHCTADVLRFFLCSFTHFSLCS